MHWETKYFVWFALLQYSLYWGGLEPNPQYLRGMPVCGLGFGPFSFFWLYFLWGMESKENSQSYVSCNIFSTQETFWKYTLADMWHTKTQFWSYCLRSFANASSHRGTAFTQSIPDSSIIHPQNTLLLPHRLWFPRQQRAPLTIKAHTSWFPFLHAKS